MKKIIIITILSLFSLICFSQTTDSITGQIIFPTDSIGKIIFADVVDIEGKSKDILYFSAKYWFVSNFISSDDVIQIDDREKGTIVGKTLLPVFSSTGMISQPLGHVFFTIRIDVKDNKYRYSITDLVHVSYAEPIDGDLSKLAACAGPLITIEDSSNENMGNKNWEGIKKQTYFTISKLVKSLEASVFVNDNDEW